MSKALRGLIPGPSAVWSLGPMTEAENSSRWQFPRPYGEYQLLERIGQGGMAEVFRARRGGAAGFEKIVVIKRILPHLAEQERFVRMFVNEAKIAAQIQHQNVVQVFDLGQHAGGELFIAMEHVSGLDLRRLTTLAGERRLFLPTWFSLHVLREVLAALAHAHDLTDDEGRKLQIVHRDVTPANIFLSYQGEVKLADFGIAKAIGENPDTEAGQVKGNVSYMSPEALFGDPLDARADVFSAGVVLWESLTQQRLFQGRSNFEIARVICDGDRAPPSRFNPEVPPDLDAAVLKALEIDRDKRFQSANEMLVPIVDALSRIRPRLVRADVREVIEALSGKGPPAADMTARAPRPKDEWMPPVRPPVTSEPTTGRISADLSGNPRAPSTDLPAIAAFGVGAWSGAVPAIPGIPIPGASLPPPGVVVAPMIAPATSAQMPAAVNAPPAILTADGRLEMGAVIDEWLDWATQGTTNTVTAQAPEEPIELDYQSSTGRGKMLVKSAEGNVSGPFTAEELMKYRGAKPSEISADKSRWMDIRTFVQISGIDRLAPTPPPLRRVTLVGKLETRSFCSILAQLGRDRATGKLVLMESGHREAARREIHMVRGAPVFVFSDHPTMQLPALLTKHKIVREDQLDTLLAQAIDRATPLLDLIPWSAFADVNRYWPLMMRDRLAEVFRWGAGRFAFDAEAEPPRSTPFARSTLQLLAEGVHRSFNLNELTNMLGKTMNEKLARSPAFEGLLRPLSLTEKQTEIAQRLGQRRTIGELLRKYPSDSQQQLVLAYVLIEIGALTASV